MSVSASIKGFFVTGSDTNVGKTIITASLSLALTNRGKRVCAIKPVASGCNRIGKQLFNDDALLLQQYNANYNLAYADINPFAFREAIAPHLVAKKSDIKLTVTSIIKKTQRALVCNADFIIVEGAGGWFTPLNSRETMADLAKAYGYPVILVVGIRLGCINHAFLTYQCIQTSGVQIAGWIANVIDRKMLYLRENILSIQRGIEAPLLGIVPYVKEVNPNKVYQFLQLTKILKRSHRKRKKEFSHCNL
ncbi:MAG: dethiobiotin synthase [Coxiellaceae bacterium]|jgi:dethiobiotin synthetase|nr:dethiobiotin synthase [Coxiellaceae bacterium]